MGRRWQMAWFVVRVFFGVLVRRIFRGRKHPSWSLRMEVAAEVMQRVMRKRRPGQPGPGDEGDPLRRIASPIPGALAERCSLEKTSLAGMRAEVHTPRGDGAGGATVLYFHGGGYTTCSPRTHRPLLARLAHHSGARCVAVEYRKAPQDPFPAAVQDAVAAYRALLDEGVDPARLAVGGDSAGGGLTLALLQRLRSEGLDQPACAILLSPWVNLASSAASIEANAPYDYLPSTELSSAGAKYVGEHDVDDPLISAIHADFTGLPPMLMQTGDLELFRDDNLRLAARAQEAGVALDHEVEEGMTHVFQLLAGLEPRAGGALRRLGAYVRTRTAADAGAPDAATATHAAPDAAGQGALG